MEKSGLIPARSDAVVQFSRYPDGTLRLYKPGSILDDTPAGYSEQNVVVKALVKRQSEEFMVTIPITRTQLDNPSAESFLHETAYSHKHERAEDYATSKSSNRGSGGQGDNLRSRPATISTSTSDSNARLGAGSSDTLGTDERGEDSSTERRTDIPESVDVRESSTADKTESSTSSGRC